MSEGPVIQGVVLAHGAMAKGLVDAVARISGMGEEALLPVTNDGKSPEVLRGEISEILARGPALIFVDLPSGSCAVTARACCLEEEGAAVIFGVNLPILLDFVFHRTLPLEDLVPRLLEKGRDSLTAGTELSDHGHRTLPG